MKSQWLLRQVFAIFILLAALFSLVACGKEEQVLQPSFPTTEFVSTTKLFSLYVPTGWSTQEVIPGADLIMATSEAALEHYRSERALESGDLVLNVGFLPLALLQEKELSHLGIQFDSPPDEFLQSLLPMFAVGDKPARNVAGEAKLVSLGDGREAGMLAFSEEGREGSILVFSAGKDVFAFISAAAYPSELSEFQEIIYAVAAGVAYNGSQDALYQKLNGG